MNGVKGRRRRNPMNTHNPATNAKVVITSPITTVSVVLFSPGIVAPKATLRPIKPQASSGTQPTEAPINCATT